MTILQCIHRLFNPLPPQRLPSTVIIPEGNTVMLCGDSNFERWSVDTLAGYTVVNAGVSGIRAGNYLPWLKKVVWNRQPNVIVLMVGTNDGEKKYTSLQQYQHDLSMLVSYLKSKSKGMIMLGILPSEIPKHNANLPPYNDIAHDVALRSGVGFVNLRPYFVKDYTVDGTHLNYLGYSRLQTIVEIFL